jgi:hypothetical protein
MEPEGSLSYSQVPATGPVLRMIYLVQVYFFKLHFGIILPFTHVVPKSRLFPSGFLTKIL